MKSEKKFTGTFFEVRSTLEEWKAANPTRRIVREGWPVASEGNAWMLDEPVWVLTIEYEE
jgi:hypothetical protein